MSPITTRTHLTRTVRTAELTATLLRQPGFHRLGQEERNRIASVLDDLAAFARVRYEIADDAPPVTSTLHDAAHKDDDGMGDLFGVPTA